MARRKNAPESIRLKQSLSERLRELHIKELQQVVSDCEQAFHYDIGLVSVEDNKEYRNKCALK